MTCPDLARLNALAQQAKGSRLVLAPEHPATPLLLAMGEGEATVTPGFWGRMAAKAQRALEVERAVSARLVRQIQAVRDMPVGSNWLINHQEVLALLSPAAKDTP